MTRVALAVAVLALVGGAGCGGKLTEIVLVVDSDIPTPGTIDAIHIVVTGPSMMNAIDTVRAYTGAPPLTLSLLPRGAVLEPVTIVVEGEQGGGTVVVSRKIVTGFDDGVQRVLHVRLSRACIGIMCAASESCDAGACVMQMVAPSSLPAWTGKVSVPELCNGYDDDGNGTADDTFHLDSDPLHCGTCSNACSGGEPCVSSHCQTSPIVQVSVGADQACILRMGGTMACWGGNVAGELGTGDTMTHTTPVTVGAITDAVQISAAYDYTCVVRRTGEVRCFGSNGNGESGQPDVSNNVMVPSAVPGVANAVAVSAGNLHTCALQMGGSVICWGNNNMDGRLGIGTSSAAIMPPGATVTGLVDAARVSNGSDHSCVRHGVGSSGAIQCWGSDLRGQLGDDGSIMASPGYSTTPGPIVLVGGMGSAMLLASDVSAGNAFTCAIEPSRSGAVVCWGDNTSGQIGLATPMMWDPTSGPHVVPGITNAVQISAAMSGGSGSCSACAVGSDALVYCWGCNGNGQLGDGTTISRSTAMPVSGLDSVSQVSVGATTVCALKTTDGSVWCWGDNSTGTLGNGTMTNSTLPVRVSGL